MCVAIPGRVIQIFGGTEHSTPAAVQFPDGVRRIDLVMLDGVLEGDHVITHSGYAIRRLTESEAAAAARIWRDANG